MVRVALLLLALLGICRPAMAGARTASMRIGAQVVASVSFSASATPRGIGIEMRSFGAKPGSVLVRQRSGAPLRLRRGAHLPHEGEPPLEVEGEHLQLALRRATSPAEVVVTVFTDGAPPRT